MWPGPNPVPRGVEHGPTPIQKQGEGLATNTNETAPMVALTWEILTVEDRRGNLM